MARLWSSGFELNSVTAGMEWTVLTNSPTIQTTTVRSGTYAMRVNPAGATANLAYDFLASGGGTDNLFLRFYLRIASSTNALDDIFRIRDTAAAVNVAGFRLNSDRTLELWDSGNVTQIGSDSSALSVDTWYRIELKYEYHATTPTVTGYIDGTSFATGTLVNLGNNNPNRILLGAITATTCDLYFDDVAVNDSTGSFQNDLPGEGEIIHLRPNATGDNNALGGLGATTNYQSVDEVTPDDGITTVSSLTDDVGDTDDYGVADTPAALASDDTINCVQL